ncbi:MAG: hypothetical protein Q4B26_13565 [Eubacteriales bacterium]|nr:hypothetical protein [Eubacteriales bacterium]
MKNNHSWRKIIAFIIGIPILIVLVFIVGVTALIILKDIRRDPTPAVTEPKTYTMDELIPFDIADSQEDLPVSAYTDTRSGRFGKLVIYDMDQYDLAYGDERITREDIKSVIYGNSKIPEQYRSLLSEFTEMVLDTYPDLDLRPLYHNLQTLEVIESDNDLMWKSVSNLSYGCYRIDENKIYVKENFEFNKHTWAYQVIMHEFAHCARSSRALDRIEIGSSELYYDSVILNEALNSLFTVQIFDYEERDIAYQLQSNMVQVMINCMNQDPSQQGYYNYDDYMRHSNSYFFKKLDEFNGNHNYAWAMIRLMEVQYNDYHNDEYEIEQEYFYPLYDYIAQMYYRTHITDNMSREECEAVADELIEQVTYDVPEEYKLETEEFYRYLEKYLNEGTK